MSPEQISGEGVDPRSDLYALAHIAFALLVGQPYWLEEAKATEAVYPLLLKIVQGAKEPASIRARRLGVALPPGFEPWFAKATALAPAQRFSSARELITTLATALGVTVPVTALSGSAGDWSLVSDRAAVIAALQAHPKASSVPVVIGAPQNQNPSQNPGGDSGAAGRGYGTSPPPSGGPGVPQAPSFSGAPYHRPSFGMTPPPPPPSYPSAPPNPYPSQPPGTPTPPMYPMPTPQAFPTPPHFTPPHMIQRPVHGANATASDLTATIPFRKPSSVARWLIAGAVVALIGATVIAFLLIFRPGSSSRSASPVEVAQPPPLLSVTAEPAPPPSASPTGEPSALPTASPRPAETAGSVPTATPVPNYGRPRTPPNPKTKKPGSQGGSYDPLRDL
jgi:hypothetical protein